MPVLKVLIDVLKAFRIEDIDMETLLFYYATMQLIGKYSTDMISACFRAAVDVLLAQNVTSAKSAKMALEHHYRGPYQKTGDIEHFLTSYAHDCKNVDQQNISHLLQMASYLKQLEVLEGTFCDLCHLVSQSSAVRSNLIYIENKIKEKEQLQEVARTHLVERPTLELPRLSRMKKVKRAIGKRFRRISDSTRRRFQVFHSHLTPSAS